MEKDTKLGVSIGLIGVVCFFAAYFNTTASIIIFVLLLLFAENKKVKINATSSLIFSVIINLITALCDKIGIKFEGFLSWLLVLGQKNDDYYKVMVEVIRWTREFDLFIFISGLLNIIFLVMTIVFVVKALKGGIVKVPFIQDKINEAFDYKEN